ncbi:hypothetical protein GOBAR_AA40121 [Gossypium barbadense]|uniref:SWIM-type domain-containing protein n=1 Tax=Gossypium barbadense TaxID=3634 RepID=A0A2P5VP25_GOSBA|nr:hypothetical protein GOBAR_AA40121 [Gossypium barbadense]
MTSTSNGWQSTSDWRHCETSIRRDDVLPTMSTGEGTFYIAHNDRSDDESDTDPPREASPDGVKVALFFDPKPLPTILEDVEGGSDDEEEDLRFRAYSPLAHMYNVDLSQDDAVEFPDLPHRRRDCTSSLLDLGELEVGKEFSNKDSFLGASKQHSIMNGVNYNMLKSKSDKFEAKCVVQDSVSEDHPNMDSDMLATLILPTMKADPRTSVPVLIANIRSQLRPHEGVIGGQYCVHLRNRTCDCGRFDALRYLCAHVIAACQNLRLDPMSYVDECHIEAVDGSMLDSSFDQLSAGVVVPPAGDLVVGVVRVTHLDRIITVTVFASPMVEVFESRKVMKIGRKKSSPMAPRTIPHATSAYISAVDSE